MVFELWLVKNYSLNILSLTLVLVKWTFFYFFSFFGKKIWMADVKLNSSLWLFFLNWKVLKVSFLNLFFLCDFIEVEVHELSKSFCGSFGCTLMLSLWVFFSVIFYFFHLQRMVDEEELQFHEEYVNEQDPSILHFLLASGDDVCY